MYRLATLTVAALILSACATQQFTYTPLREGLKPAEEAEAQCRIVTRAAVDSHRSHWGMIGLTEKEETTMKDCMLGNGYRARAPLSP